MILEIKLNWKDYLNAIRLHSRPAPWLRITRIVLALSGALLYGYILGTLFKIELTIVSMLPVVLSFLGFFVWYVIYLPFKADKVYQQQKALQEPFTLKLVEDGIEYTSGVASADLTWDYFPQWKESEKIFLLYHSDELFQVIPKSIFKDQDMKAFREVLTANVKKST